MMVVPIGAWHHVSLPKAIDIYSRFQVTFNTAILLRVDSIKENVLLRANYILLICNPGRRAQLDACLSMGGGQIERPLYGQGGPKNQPRSWDGKIIKGGVLIKGGPKGPHRAGLHIATHSQENIFQLQDFICKAQISKDVKIH